MHDILNRPNVSQVSIWINIPGTLYTLLEIPQTVSSLEGSYQNKNKNHKYST